MWNFTKAISDIARDMWYIEKGGGECEEIAPHLKPAYIPIYR